MTRHFLPLAAQRSHWYLRSSGAVPFQLPARPLSTRPLASMAGSRETVGRLRLIGRTAATASLAALIALALPNRFAAVTLTAIRWPTSSAVSVYVLAAAS